MVRLARLWSSLLAVVGAIVGGGLGGCGDAPITIAAVSAERLWEGLGCGTRGCEGACTADGCPGGRRVRCFGS